jgi:regulator of sigma E protease
MRLRGILQTNNSLFHERMTAMQGILEFLPRIIVAIFMFGLLIFVHELGHFLAAKATNIKVNDFSIGMGPKLFGFQKGETQFALRLFPMGGSCSMEGEEEGSNEPRAFSNQPRWARFIVLIAGSFMNFLMGVAIVLTLTAGIQTMAIPIISGFPSEVGTSNGGLLPGDEILKINGQRVYVTGDISLLLDRYAEPVYEETDGERKLVGYKGDYEMQVRRNGQKMTIQSFLEKKTRTDDDGSKSFGYGLRLTVVDATFGRKLAHTWNTSVNYLRLVRMGLVDLISGKAGVEDLSGPIGITAMMVEVVGEQQFTLLWGFLAFISINLAFMNLLPIPALDGARILFLAIDGILALFGKKGLKTEHENYVHLAGFALLMLLMVYVGYQDVARLLAK